MRNPFRRRTDPCARTVSLSSGERYAVTDTHGRLLGHEPMPADWPPFTADLFEQAWPDRPDVDGPVVWDAERRTVTPIAEHPAVVDLRRTLDHINDPDRPDPLEAHAALMLQRHEEDIAYAAGADIAADGLRGTTWDHLDTEDALIIARRYLTGAAIDKGTHDDRCEAEFIEGPYAWTGCGCHWRTQEVAAHLAALVLAGYTHTPRELVA